MSSSSVARSSLLSVDILPIIQAFQCGLYEDLLPSHRTWNQTRTRFDSKRQQTMCQAPQESTELAVDEYFVDDVTDRSFPLHHAIVHGSLSLVQRWIQCRGREIVTRYAMDCAAAHGQMAILQWLHHRNFSGCTTDAMDFAALRGHLNVVTFLHCHRAEGGRFLAMDFAAGQGHLDVVKYLHTHRREGCSTMAMDAAASNGHLDVLVFLHTHRREGFTSKAIEGAKKYGHHDIAAYLQSISAARLEALVAPHAQVTAA
ncbi:hypothetical protein H257_16536 [Aphanomyces astaci]|uniref:Uncharacterized protein n=2 Tax=Aphanomyces astaci TaxID=112090 RepID=W4FIF7_APHAT|nr:hypothetical protein H257_16536 [Aphanomyces astaci]ETV67302.1 hypothetical protein H257_16536 [Aphanomyces astaci]|eukprot:XP_009843290.1 hypothetical protein H257_16536 [Aphanomyces astaci]